MLSLALALPIHPTEVLYLDDDTCSDLVNRFGRKLERLFSLSSIQCLEVLRGAKKGGHIRWHILAKDQTVISSDSRDGCWNIYEVSVGIEEPGSRVVPPVLDEKNVQKFIQALGVDLDDIRKLGGEQVGQVFEWLRDAGMIECFELQQNYVPVKINSSEQLGNYSANPSCYASFPLHAGDEFDRLLEQHNAFTAGSHTVIPHQEPMEVAIESVTTPESNAAAPCSVNRTPTGQPVAHLVPDDKQLQHQPFHTPLSTGSPFQTPAATPLESGPFTGPETIPSSCPTPSRSYLNSPLEDKPLAPLVSSIASPTKIRLLQSCRFGKDDNEFLEESRVKPTLRAEAGILSEDRIKLLQSLLDHREDDTLPALQALGLPLQWRGLEGAVIYYRTLEAEKTKPFLDPLAKRIAQMLFYLNYKWLEKHAKRARNSVATLILDACPEEPKPLELMKSRRDNITTYHKRRGRWWWMHAACLGSGILMYAGDTIDTIINSNFTNDQLQVFISLVRRTRPGSVWLFHRWEPVIKAITLGVATSNLAQIIQDGNTDIVRQSELECVYALDREALAQQQTGETWLAIDVESIAEEKITEFLPDF